MLGLMLIYIGRDSYFCFEWQRGLFALHPFARSLHLSTSSSFSRFYLQPPLLEIRQRSRNVARWFVPVIYRIQFAFGGDILTYFILYSFIVVRILELGLDFSELRLWEDFLCHSKQQGVLSKTNRTVIPP